MLHYIIVAEQYQCYRNNIPRINGTMQMQRWLILLHRIMFVSIPQRVVTGLKPSFLMIFRCLAMKLYQIR